MLQTGCEHCMVVLDPAISTCTEFFAEECPYVTTLLQTAAFLGAGDPAEKAFVVELGVEVYEVLNPQKNPPRKQTTEKSGKNRLCLISRL